MTASGWFANFGPLEVELRARFAERFGVDEAQVATAANATLALTGAVATAQPREWTVPSLTFTATAAAVMGAGRALRFADVRPDDWWLDTRGIPQQSEHDEGVILVAPYGSDLGPVRDLPHEHVIVDAAASVGAIGALAWLPPTWAVIVSLHATKVLGIGEGAVVVFGTAERTEAFQRWQNFGLVTTRSSEVVGTNAKLCEPLAVVAHAALDGWEDERAEWLAARRSVEEVADDLGLTLHPATRGTVTPYTVAVLPDAATTAEVEEVVSEHGVGTRRWWAAGCHRMPAYAAVPHPPLPVTEDLAARTLGLPMFRGFASRDAEMLHAALADARRRTGGW